MIDTKPMPRGHASAFRHLVPGCALAAAVWGQSLTAAVWRESGFADFADGTFSDGGANAYVSASGRIQLINRWDFNGDGEIDILSANSHPLLEMLDMSIYWGNGRDFDIQRHSYVPADGPMWVAPGDFNRDGRVDLAVANYSNGTWTNMDSAVYWGAHDGPAPAGAGQWSAPPFQGKSMLPTRNAQGVISADLNRDGFPEIVYALSSGFWEYRGTGGVPESRIYWNRAGSFSREDFTQLATRGATDVDAADVNGDGWQDLAFSISPGRESVVYLGGPDGYSEEKRLVVPTADAHAVRLADINGDQQVDLLFANEAGSESYAYLNRGGTFAAGDRIALPTHHAKDVVVADFNRDGHADIFFTNHLFAEAGLERFGTRMTTSYLYWGGRDGFSADRRDELQTIGAWGANAADLNGDGWVDLLVCNFQEHYSYEVPSFVYWNGPSGFDVTRRTSLYEHGAQGNAIADFNGDGHLDLLLTSMMGRSRADYDPCYLYVGRPDGLYSTDERITLPGREAYEQAMADLNDDGQVDILLMNQGEVTRYENEVFVYWNDRNALDPWRVTGLPAFAGVGVEVADLDRDGHLDVIVANNKSYPRTGAGIGDAARASGSLIYWGSADGYVVTQRTEIPVWRCRSPSVADINRDGHLDLVFAGEGASIFFGDGTRSFDESRRQRLQGTLGAANHQTEVADLNRDGYLDIIFAGTKVQIFLGDAAHTYAAADRQVLDIDAKTMTVADVNQDGWLDLVCPLYKLGGRRSLESSVLLGGANGFGLDRRIVLPTDGATGSLVSDFNHDGFNDLFFFCHRTDGDAEVAGRYADHHTDSRLYWGSATGFDPTRFHRIPTIGAHYDMGVDLGDIAQRRTIWEYTSSVHDTGGRKWTQLTWEAETPARTAVRFQVRAAATADALREAEWQGPGGPGTYFDSSGANLERLKGGRWIQYKAVLDAANGASSPILTSVEIGLD